MVKPWIRPLFVIAAAYDLILGFAFILFQRQIFAWFEVTPPNHMGYVLWGAVVVAIFGCGFWLVARSPVRNRDIILMGICFKLAYATVVLGYWFLSTIPNMWVPWAFADLVFAALFLAALRSWPAPATD
jgi:hypothetical protein